MSSLRAKYLHAMRFNSSQIAADNQLLKVKLNPIPQLTINTAICQTYSSPNTSPSQHSLEANDSPIDNSLESSLTPPSNSSSTIRSCSRILFSPTGKRKPSNELKEEDSKKVKLQDSVSSPSSSPPAYVPNSPLYSLTDLTYAPTSPDAEYEQKDMSTRMFSNMCELESMKLVVALRHAHGDEFKIKSIYKQSVSRLLVLINSMNDSNVEDRLLDLANTLKHK